jgi:hypothetical protein
MPGTISTSVTAGDAKAYVYPADTDYVLDHRADTVLYSLDLAPRKDH